MKKDLIKCCAAARNRHAMWHWPGHRLASSICLGLILMGIGSTAVNEAVAGGKSIFAPAGCEFSVTFPSVPLITAAPAPPPRAAVSAEVRFNLTHVQALCTTGYPEGILKELDDDQIRSFSQTLARQVGVREAELRLFNSGETRSVDIIGVIGRLGHDQVIRAQIWYGETSRLIIQITSAREDTDIRFMDAILHELDISPRGPGFTHR